MPTIFILRKTESGNKKNTNLLRQNIHDCYNSVRNTRHTYSIRTRMTVIFGVAVLSNYKLTPAKLGRRVSTSNT